MDEALRRARELLRDLTPLKSDCGRLCGAACCRSAEGEETGMLLFPGEEALYAADPTWRLKETERGTLAFCSGRCRREERPLACQIFPLLPVVREEGVRVALDLRAAAVCPLRRRGLAALDPAFRMAVREAGGALMGEARQAAFLRRLTEEQDELRRLRRQFGGEGRV